MLCCQHNRGSSMAKMTEAQALIVKQLDGKPVKAPKWAEAARRAQMTGKMANTLAKALAKRYAYRWQFIDFLGPNKRESAGIVDILAIRKSSRTPLPEGLKKLDAFDLQIIQVKGGKALRPSPAEILRMRSSRPSTVRIASCCSSGVPREALYSSNCTRIRTAWNGFERLLTSCSAASPKFALARASG